MDDLIKKIEMAKTDVQIMNTLVTDYMPLLKKEAGRYGNVGFDYDEKLSLAMLMFVTCIKQYDPEAGNFISFFSISLRNRLIDQWRSDQKHLKAISLDDVSQNESDNICIHEQTYSEQIYNRENEEDMLRDEIEMFNKELESNSLTYRDLVRSCPKQKRSRRLCIRTARSITDDSLLLEKFVQTGRLPQSEAALRTGISSKSIEKYRKYIVALIILFTGDYPGITSFIPHLEDNDK